MRICGGRLVALRRCALLSLSLVAQSPSAAPRPGAALGPEVAIGEPSAAMSVA